MEDVKTKVEPVNGETQMVMVPSAVIAEIKALGESVRLVLINELSEPSRSAFWAGVDIRNLAAIAEDGDKANAAPQPAASDVPHDVVRAEAIEECAGVVEDALRGSNERLHDWQRQNDRINEAKEIAALMELGALRHAIRALATPSTSTEGLAKHMPSRERMLEKIAGDPDDASCEAGSFDCLDPTSTEEALRAENARLRDLMKPFSDDRNADPMWEPFGIPDEHPVTLTDDHRTSVNVGHFRRIREALSALSR